jgi:hypothetical protein
MKKITQLLLFLFIGLNGFGQCPTTNLPFVAQAQIDSFIVLNPNCTEITGDLVIQGAGITNLNGLANITNITGNLIINQASSLQNVNGLSSLQSIGGSLGIVQTGLLNLNGLSSLTSIGGDLGIQGNLSLTDISGLENIDATTISGTQGLYILGNPNLSICNLSNFCTYLSFPAGTHPRTISANGSNCGSVAVITASCSTDCPSGDLVFSTQADINSFAFTYPSCTHILGNVTIEGNMTNLNPLANLTNISGNLTIQNTTALSNINGLISLVNIGGNVTISQNSALQDVNGLNFVTSIGGNLTVSNNTQLNSIIGLQNINPGTISALQIQNNTALAVCNIPNLCTYLLNPSATHPRTITGNAAACINEIAVMGSCSLTCPVGDIVFLTQAQVNGFLTAYPDCTEITGSLTIQGNGISNLNGLTNINSISGNLVINQATNLSNLDGLSTLESIGGSMGIAQSGVQHLDGLNSLTSIGGALVLQANPQLNDISGLASIDPITITGLGLTIINNPQVSICNLPNLCTYLAYPASSHPRNIFGNTGICESLADVIISCLPPVEECEVPTTLSVSDINATSAIINWAGSGDLFDLEHVIQGGSPTEIPTFSGITPPFTLQNLVPDTYYRVYIRQVCENNNTSSVWKSISFLTSPEIPEDPFNDIEDESNQGDDVVHFIFTTQTEIDEFAVNNSDLNIITGNVIIRGGTSITNLYGLSGITKINGNLIIGGFDSLNDEGQLVNNKNQALISLEGLNALTEVGENVVIQNNSVLTSLDGLNALTTIGKDLIIGDHKRYNSPNNIILNGGNPQLQNLNGLSALTSIGGNLTIADNDALENINGLSGLSQVGNTSNSDRGNIYIGGNAQLLNLNGLSALTQIKGNLSIGSSDRYYYPYGSGFGIFLDNGANDMLESINGLSNIINIEKSLVIENNPELLNLDGLDGLTTIGESLSIRNNISLASLEHLSSLTTIGSGNLSIEGNSSLHNLNGLNNINSLDNLYIAVNQSLENINGLSNSITSLNSLEIIGNQNLDNLNGLQSITNLDNALVRISNNPLIDNLGLTNVTSSQIGIIEIIGNHNLQDMTGLSSSINEIGRLIISFNNGIQTINLNSVTTINELSIDSNATLETINLIGTTELGILNIAHNPNVQHLNLNPSVANLGSLTIRGNNNLTSLSSFSNITNINASVYIGHNPSLANLQGLESLTTIGGPLAIESNNNLENLDELSALTAVGGEVLIRENAELTDISGLQNINPETIGSSGYYYNVYYYYIDYYSAYQGGLIIVHNPELMACNLPNFCVYLANPATTHPRSIWGNAGSCINAGPCLIPPVECPTGDFVFSSQADVTGFQFLYGSCSDIILDNVSIGNIDIYASSPIQAVSFLENVVGITENLVIQNTSALTSLAGLNQIVGVGRNLTISNNNALENLDGINNIGNIGKDITISINPNLENIDGLGGLINNTINGNLRITNNQILQELIEFNTIIHINGTLEIQKNPQIQSINFSNLEVANRISISSNNQLQNLNFNSLTEVNNTLTISNNNSLQNLNGLNNLTAINEGLSITGNNALLNLNHLSNLNVLGGSLFLENNPQLTSATGLENIEYENINRLSIINNPLFSACNFPNICEFIIAKPGNSVIFGNHPDCSNLEAVSNNCFAGNCGSFTIWKNNKWSNREPKIQTRAIIMDEFTVSENIEACELEVYQIGNLIIDDEGVLSVKGQIINRANTEDFVIENEASLIQIDDVSNIGNITVKRNSNPMFRLDYTLWSSPVAGQNLQAFSPATLPTRIYKYDAATDSYDNAYPENTFLTGQGYLFRSPNNWIENDGENSAEQYNGVFKGAPHNGDIIVNVISDAYNGLGNPYASSIDASILFDENPNIQTIYFWTNSNPPVDGSYLANNWASWTTTGGTSADGSIIEPNGEIAVGQGFIAQVNGNTSVTFNNDMRIGGAGMFFRAMQDERHRLWLNLVSNELTLNQILIGYVSGATQGEDNQIDGEMFGYGESALYSLINNSDKEFVIQGRSLPFEPTDVVPLGFKATTAGEFMISLANFDGLFAEGQNIYLKDNVTQIVHNLKEGAYAFISEEGTFDTRFEVVYQTTMSVDTPNLDNNWIVFKQAGQFQIMTQGFDMKSVQVFDMLGRTVYASVAEGTTHTIARIDANQVLIVKITTADGDVLTKKVQN